MTTTTELPIYVLFGSQMGNSEFAAKQFCKHLSKKNQEGYFDTLAVETKCCTLDDFLELHHANYTPIVIIFVSSYGVGQAPLGSYRFRDLCDAWIEQTNQTVLNGLQFAICGFGDSSYDTYLENPTHIQNGLLAAGATPIGTMGTIDANVPRQEQAIQDWMASIWEPLQQAVQTANSKPINSIKMQQDTIQLLKALDPDYKPPVLPNVTKSTTDNNDSTTTTTSTWNNATFLVSSIIFVIIAIGMKLVLSSEALDTTAVE